MQSIIFPMKYMRITQKWGSGTHKYGYPVDNAGKDTGIDSVFSPFDGVIKKIYDNGNSVWIESTSKVKYADGTEDYCTVMLTHDNYVKDLKVGQKLKQGQIFYQEGTAGTATANHVHIEVTKGKFTGTGWHQESNGQWVTNNPYQPNKAFFLKDVIVLNDGGLTWTKYGVTPPKNKDTLYAGEVLNSNQAITSLNGRYRAVMQADGNFVVYNLKKAIWASNTWKSGAKFATMQKDGNFVIYVKWGKPVWASKTNGKKGVKLVMQNDGNLVIYTEKHKPVWATGTNGK